jgi:hypothetical protein
MGLVLDAQMYSASADVNDEQAEVVNSEETLQKVVWLLFSTISVLFNI